MVSRNFFHSSRIWVTESIVYTNGHIFLWSSLNFFYRHFDGLSMVLRLSPSFELKFTIKTTCTFWSFVAFIARSEWLRGLWNGESVLQPQTFWRNFWQTHLAWASFISRQIRSYDYAMSHSKSNKWPVCSLNIFLSNHSRRTNLWLGQKVRVIVCIALNFNDCQFCQFCFTTCRCSRSPSLHWFH